MFLKMLCVTKFELLVFVYRKFHNICFTKPIIIFFFIVKIILILNRRYLDMIL